MASNHFVNADGDHIFAADWSIRISVLVPRHKRAGSGSEFGAAFVHSGVGKNMILSGARSTDEISKFPETPPADSAQFSPYTLLHTVSVHDTEIRLPVNPYLSERHWIAAVDLQMRQELWQFHVAQFT